jgi:hypothetical protein
MAMLSVALLTILASAALWQQWRTLSVESAERDAQQTAWLLRSAQDWALVVLREDGRSDSIDHLAEPWAVPLSEARLSAFLAASSDGSVNDSESLTQQVFLSGRITDMQSRLNVSNLVQAGQVHAPSLRAFNTPGQKASDLSMQISLRDLHTASLETIQKIGQESCGFKSIKAEEAQKLRAAVRTALTGGLSLGITEVKGSIGDGSLEGGPCLLGRPAHQELAKNEIILSRFTAGKGRRNLDRRGRRQL